MTRAKADLMEALLDHLAQRGRLDRLPEAFRNPDPVDALMHFIEVFCGFWASDRSGLRRIRAWAAVEDEDAEAGHGRDAWRREGLQTLVGRLRGVLGVPPEKSIDDAIDVLHTLTSFETYDALAQYGRDEHEIAALLQQTARSLLGLDAA